MSQDGRLPFDVNRRKIVKSLGVAGVAGLAGCSGTGNGTDTATSGGQDDTETDTATDTPTETATPADKDQVQMGGELIATFGADVKNFDPTKINDTTSGKAFGLVYESLLATDFSGKPQPVLATSLEQKESDLMWRATLREGVMFHGMGDFEAREVTAEDVKVSYERYEGSPREADVYDWYDSSTVVDDYTIDIKLSRKYAPLKFAIGNVPIVPREVEQGDLDLTETPIGTGPYRFVQHEPDSLFRIERNDEYWFGGNDNMPEQPPIETVTFRVITEQSAQLAALQGGDVDMINNIPAASYSDLKNNSDFNVTERVEGGFDMFIYPMGVTPFDNRKVRRGITRLIPREAIVESVYSGIGLPAYSPISPLAQQFTSKEFNERMGEEYAAYDPEAATTLLEEGFSEAGVSAPFETRIITNQNPQRVKWSQLIQESLNSTEFFDVGIEQFEWNTYVGKILAEDAHTNNTLIALGWSAGWDPDAYVHNLFHTKQFTPACCNVPHYSVDEVDTMIDNALQTYDIEERKSIYQDLQERIVQDSPMAFIRFGNAMDAVDADVVKGFSTYPIDGAEYAGVYAPYSDRFTWVDK
jgi:peptide/nickel transport system substrate-binding protein